MTNSPLLACQEKQGFTSFIDGKRAVDRIRKFQSDQRDDPIDLYRCSYCANWHIGTRPKRRRSERRR